jgi:predicted transglutaminase-like cysteine proteinase
LKRVTESIRTGSKDFFRIRPNSILTVGTKTMRQTIKAATVAATLIVSCSLPYASHADLDNARGLNVVAEQASFDMPAAAPIEFLAISREFTAQMQRLSFTTPTPAEFVAQSHEPQPKAKLASLDMSAPRVALPPRPAGRQAHAHPVDFPTPSPAPVAIRSLPRRFEANVDRISFDTPTLAPMAFVRFCMRYSDDCKVHGMEFQSSPVELTTARRAELVKVNREVNRAIRPQENLKGVMAEEWLVAPGKGDCNDYAVTKRHKLLMLGWPSRSLLLAEVVVSSGEHHLILVVRTREDDFVLDNLNRNVRPVSQIPYRWVRAQQPKNPRFWSMISVTGDAQVAMNNR